jgi:hypothetical protein
MLVQLEGQGHMQYEQPAVVKRQQVRGLLATTISDTEDTIDRGGA